MARWLNRRVYTIIPNTSACPALNFSVLNVSADDDVCLRRTEAFVVSIDESVIARTQLGTGNDTSNNGEHGTRLTIDLVVRHSV